MSSQSVPALRASAPSLDDGGYCTPTDRIGRAYTPQSSGLTMEAAATTARLVQAKPMAKSPSNASLGAYPLSPSHSAATLGPPFQDAVLAEAATDLGSVGNDAAGLSAAAPAPLSPQAQRSVRRAERNSPAGYFVEPSTEFAATTRRVDEFAWNPMVISEAETAATAPPASAEGGDDAARAESRASYQAAVAQNVSSGALHAAGAGQRRALADLPDSWIQDILEKVATNEPLAQAAFEPSRPVVDEIETIRSEHAAAVARAMVDYDLHDARQCALLGVDPAHLKDAQTAWTSPEYTSDAWRVLRRTGVSRQAVHHSFDAVQTNLCTVDPVMLGLQALWMDGEFPVGSAVAGYQDPGAATNFGALLLTDASTRQLRRKLPVSLPAICTHVERCATAARDAMRESWLPAAAEMLNNRLTDLSRAAALPPVPVVDAAGNTAVAPSLEDNVDSEETLTRASNLMNAAATLMSRQLRGMCEDSLAAFAGLFTGEQGPYDCVFKLNLVVLEDVEMGGPLVRLEPTLEQLQDQVGACIEHIVKATKDFPRPDGSVHGAPESPAAFLSASAVTLTDDLVRDVRERINASLAKYFQAPSNLVDEFGDFALLVNGDADTHVAQALAARHQATDTVAGLEALFALSERLVDLAEDVRLTTNDLCYYPVFMVNCVDAKEALAKKSEALHELITSSVLDDTRGHMDDICHEYKEMAGKLAEEPHDSAELALLNAFAVKSTETMSQLGDEYLGQVHERIRFLLDRQCRIPKEDLQVLHATYNWPSNVKTNLNRSNEMQAQRKRELVMVVEGQQEQLSRELGKLEKSVDKLATEGSLAPDDVQKTCKRIKSVAEGLEAALLEAETIKAQEVELSLEVTDNVNKISEIQKALQPMEKLWKVALEWTEQNQLWRTSPLSTVKPDQAERTTGEILGQVAKLVKQLGRKGDALAVPARAAKRMQDDIKLFLKEDIPLMLLICTPGIRERHWKDIKKATGLTELNVNGQTNLDQMKEIGLHHHINDIEETCVAASKENSLESAMDKMESAWAGMKFELKDWRGSYIFTGMDEIQQELDDQIMRAQAMRGSRYIKPFLERIIQWEKTLVTLQEIIDSSLKVQVTWLYLEPIFSSDDIKHQMPKEAAMFNTVDTTWRRSMTETLEEPGVMFVAKREGLLEGLTEANTMLDFIQKGLNDYLEQKRLYFPRFFFLSNDELLEILAETKDPRKVQPHLKKCFDGIGSLHFAQNLDIEACYDPKGEKLPFQYHACKHPMINPNNFGGASEAWLLEVEVVMHKTLAHTIDIAMVDYGVVDRIDWVQKWPGQVVLTDNQMVWTLAIEAAIKEADAPAAVRREAEESQAQLVRIIELVRGDIDKRVRSVLGALVVMDVHNRDVTHQLSDLGVSRITEFDWLAQLRYYWANDGKSALSGEPSSVLCAMINAKIEYAFEYVGNQSRLVITPLTDRCYRTLMGAIHLNLGGAPEGPAGTGKTETVKDLGKACAIQCVVTNCSDGLDYKAMGKFFKGLASAGAWACFDEFNRIQLEVLSVIAQQILTIQQAKFRGAKSFLFEGTELTLKMTCCPFITMNPGYAGRAELPDNLKVLFRTVAMMVPDYAMISEIILYSFGYTEAKPLSVKIVTTYKLCSEQLSSQCHYDYGMRAVMAVLRAAGNLKRAEGHLDENVLMLRSIMDVNLPKFLQPDVPLFGGIVSDLFPGVTITPPDRDAMETAFKEVCVARGLQAVDYFWNKITQIYDMMIVRHGFMIVGDPFSGKSLAWKVLADTLELLHKKEPEDVRWTKVIPFVMNPKSITMGQLYGMFDAVSHEWTDGVLAINYRNAASNKVGQPEDRKWILFDGPVDAIWIENMNTVLDDNKKLCLMSGEIIAMSDQMSMMFEPMDLLVASPATVSRCGMVYMEPFMLGWQVIVDSWCDRHVTEGKAAKAKSGGNELEEAEFILDLSIDDREIIDSLVDWLVEPMLVYVRREIIEMSPTLDSNLVQSLLNIFESLLEKALAGGIGAGADPDPREKRQRQQQIECCFVYSLFWSIGKSGTEASQRKFSRFFHDFVADPTYIDDNLPGVLNSLKLKKWELPDFSTRRINGTFIAPPPTEVLAFDLLYDIETSKWIGWTDTLEKFELAKGTAFSSIVVPTSYTAQMSYMLSLLISRGHEVLICGPTGTGKSCNIQKTITSELSGDSYSPITLGFSAKTSANMVQDIIDGKLDKRRKGVFGPPMGKKAIIFVDDVSMPEVETYGAQPPIELLRQSIDHNGWYNLKEKTWQTLVDCLIVCAMSPANGPAPVTPRFLRHFNLMGFAQFDESTLKRIFETIVNQNFAFTALPKDVMRAGDALVNATLLLYRASVAELLPTPKKSHYTFNLRDFSRVIGGVLMAELTESFSKQQLVRLWTHEALRVFSDRLVEEKDSEWFLSKIGQLCESEFGLDFYDTFESLDRNGDKKITHVDMRNLFWGDLMTPPEEEVRPYCEIPDLGPLSKQCIEYLADYNAQTRAPMDLVLFQFAIEHVIRISRVLRMPGGNGLLIGVGGSGRQSLSRLATFIAGYSLKQIEISKNYTTVEWREDIKETLQQAGCTDTPLVFLFSDTQIKEETFVEDISNILNSGECPNIFANDEKAEIVERVRPHAVAALGKAAGDNMTPEELYAFFIKRVKDRLHLLLAMSPIGNAFRERVRKFPSLVNCCVIDWFVAWPDDALLAVAEQSLQTLPVDASTRGSLVQMCQLFHVSGKELSTQFFDQMKRINYVTPTSYLELLLALKGSLGKRQGEVMSAKKRYENGLEKLAFAAKNVNEMQVELEALKPELEKGEKETEELMVVIQEKLPGVEKKRTEVGADAAVAQAKADACAEEKASVEADLAVAMPALRDAIQALDTIKQADINEMKSFAKPPATCKLVCEAVCVMMSIKPQRIPDPNDTSKRIMDYWGPSQTMLGDKEFINKLKGFDKDNIPAKVIAKIRDEYMTNEDFTVKNAARASSAAEGMAKWCYAMETYERVAKVVGPKREALAAAMAELKIVEAELAGKKAALKKVEDDLKGLEDALEGAMTRKAELQQNIDMCGKKIVRAEQLIDGLGGEKDRWTNFASDLSTQYTNLTGDVLISAGIMAYLGPFTALFREKQVKSWVETCQEKQIPCSDRPSLSGTLGDAVLIRQWNIWGLPTDGFSVDNGIIAFNARRWPLMIDPQGQANTWVRNTEKANKLGVVKLSDEKFISRLETSIQFGTPVLLENVGEELDPAIEPLLLKQIFKQGGVNCIRLGDNTMEYSEDFRFYITTKLRNPHYPPEVSVKVTLLNFMITPEGLCDQLLARVVALERPDLEQQKNELIIEGAANKKELQDLENQILHILSTGEGNILEDETAIETLNKSKVTSDSIKEKQKIAEKTEIEIDGVRLGYKPGARDTQVLFFTIAELANIEPVYQYSLTWFINLFVMSIKNSDKHRDIPTRLANLNEHFMYSLYRNICRSLLEKDKLLFSFLLTSRILKNKGEIDNAEWFFLLTGGVALENPHANPASDWLSDKSWSEICLLGDLPNFAGLRDDVIKDPAPWKALYDSTSPHEEKIPGKWEDVLMGVQRLCIIRVIRPDKLALAVQNFVLDAMGDKYIKPPPFDLQSCFNESDCKTPLVFILSPGSDPMSSVVKAAADLKTTMHPISLGQGQGPIAEALIERSRVDGAWCVLQNCHLAPSWMGELERIVEDMGEHPPHEGFRLWCTTYPSDVFPVLVLQNGVKMTNEPPKGLRANLLGSFSKDPIADQDFYNSCSKGPQFRKLVFALCFFHALIQERRLFGPLGWNIPYEFNDSDLKISVQQLAMFLDENDDVPFKALRYTAGECNYGGRVTDDKDRRLMACMLERMYREEMVTTDGVSFSESGTYHMPEDGEHEAYVEYIDSLPLSADPEVFGLNSNANITKDSNDTTALLTRIVLTESGGSSGGSGGSEEDKLTLTARDIFAKVPVEFDMEEVGLKYPVSWGESMNSVLSQDMLRYNGLISVVRSSLQSVEKAVQGLVVMSPDLDAVGRSMLLGQIPAMWKKASYPSLKPLASYVNDLLARLGFLAGWLAEKAPTVYWMSGFYFTHAFMTGAAQNHARKYTIPIDIIAFDFELMPKETYRNPPKDGVYSYGLFFESCRWDKKGSVLTDSEPKKIFSTAPIIWFKPLRQDEVSQYPCYECPVYKTADRRGILATTGHSTNFILFIKVPSSKPSSYWTEMGAAMMSQLSE